MVYKENPLDIFAKMLDDNEIPRGIRAGGIYVPDIDVFFDCFSYGFCTPDRSYNKNDGEIFTRVLRLYDRSWNKYILEPVNPDDYELEGLPPSLGTKKCYE